MASGGDTPAHAAGHFLNLRDLYKLRGSQRSPWMDGNIMDSGNTVSDENINEIIGDTDQYPNSVTHCSSGVSPTGGCN